MGQTTRHEKYGFGLFEARDLLIWLKDLALEPYNMKSSRNRLRNQMHKVRKLMNTSDAKRPQGKRKLEQYMNDGKFAYTFELINRDKYCNYIAKNQRLDEPSSLGCSPLFKETQEYVAFPALNDRAEHCSICCQDYSHSSDFDESIKGPNPKKQRKFKSHCEDFENNSSYTLSTKTSIREEPTIELLKELKPLGNEDFHNIREPSHSLSLENEDRKLSRSLKKFLPSMGNHCPRLVIPIGPRFQAETPEWEGTANIRHHSIDDDLKWLGTEIWPMPNIIETNNTIGVGKGRFVGFSFTKVSKSIK